MFGLGTPAQKTMGGKVFSLLLRYPARLNILEHTGGYADYRGLLSRKKNEGTRPDFALKDSQIPSEDHGKAKKRRDRRPSTIKHPLLRCPSCRGSGTTRAGSQIFLIDTLCQNNNPSFHLNLPERNTCLKRHGYNFTLSPPSIQRGAFL